MTHVISLLLQLIHMDHEPDINPTTTDPHLILGWYKNVGILREQHIPDDSVIITRDVNDTGAKYFGVVKDVMTLHSFIRSIINKDGSANIYELIPEMTTETYLAFDIDHEYNLTDNPHIASDVHAAAEKCLDIVLNHLASMLSEHYAINWTPVPGLTYQASQGNTSKKMSVHLKTNIVCKSWTHASVIADNLARYIDHVSTPEEHAFLHVSHKSKSAIDLSIYTNTRSFRTVHSCKMKIDPTEVTPLVPMKGCSNDMRNHLVRVYKHFPQPGAVYGLHSDRIDKFKPIPNAPKNKFGIIPVEVVRTPSRPPRSSHQSNDCKIPNDVVDAVVDFVTNNEKIQQILNGPVKIRDIFFKWKYAFRINLDHDECGFCPVAQRKHKSNKTYLDFDYKKGTVKYGCRDDDCKSGCQEMLPLAIFYNKKKHR